MKTEADIEEMAKNDPDLSGFCGTCQRAVDNHDPDHRVTNIFPSGGRGVECKVRGDYL